MENISIWVCVCVYIYVTQHSIVLYIVTQIDVCLPDCVQMFGQMFRSHILTEIIGANK